MMHDLPALLDAAVARGIITGPQRAALLALGQAPADAPAEAARDVPRGVLLAYGVGALAVLFAMGWFLADRWAALGAGGVLAVVAGYAALFVFAARLLRREGFALAGALALVLAVCMVPVATWAALRLAGFWPELRFAACRYAVAYCNQGWIVVELATVLAALVALRVVRVGLLTAPIGVAFLFLLHHATEAIGDTTLDGLVGGWSMVLGASLLATAAYLVDRRTPEARTLVDDPGAPLWSAAVVAATIGTAVLWNEDHALRPVLVLVGLVAAVSALSLRRRVVFVYGAGCLVLWLGWLAFEVFEDVLAFPLALGATGLAVIVATVLVQRHFPALVARLRVDDPGAPRRMPGGVPALLAPTLLALAMLPVAGREDAWRKRENEARWRAEIALSRRKNAEARARVPLRVERVRPGI